MVKRKFKNSSQVTDTGDLFFPALLAFFFFAGRGVIGIQRWPWSRRPVASPGSILGSGSAGANEPTDSIACEMQRDPAFALAVTSLERCLRVCGRVGPLVDRGRSGKHSDAGGSGAVEKELKGLRGGIAGNAGSFETDFEGVVGRCVTQCRRGFPCFECPRRGPLLGLTLC